MKNFKEYKRQMNLFQLNHLKTLPFVGMVFFSSIHFQISFIPQQFQVFTHLNIISRMLERLGYSYLGDAYAFLFLSMITFSFFSIYKARKIILIKGPWKNKIIQSLRRTLMLTISLAFIAYFCFFAFNLISLVPCDLIDTQYMNVACQDKKTIVTNNFSLNLTNFLFTQAGFSMLIMSFTSQNYNLYNEQDEKNRI